MKKLKAQAEIELSKMENDSPAKDVTAQVIVKQGLLYITVMTMGIGASLLLENSKIAAVAFTRYLICNMSCR